MSNGFKRMIELNGMPYHLSHPGETFWVDENAGNGVNNRRGTFANPDSTIESCMSRCTSGRGDVIMVKPGHIENISAAADLVCDVIGVTIIGLGSGDDQAKIVFDTADTADIDVSVSNVTFDHMWFECNFADVDGAIDVAATGTYFTIQNCRFTNTSTILNFEEVINLAAAANYFSFLNNDVHLIEGSTAESLVFTQGECLAMRVIGNNIVGEFSTSIFDVDATALTGGPIFRNNFMINLTAAADYCVEIDATTVAIFCNERYGTGGADEPLNDAAASFLIDCHGVDTANTSSILWPTTTVTWP